MRSHTEQEIRKAIENHIEVWELDTGSDGDDDVLIGSREEIEGDLMGYYEIEEIPPIGRLRESARRLKSRSKLVIDLVGSPAVPTLF